MVHLNETKEPETTIGNCELEHESQTKHLLKSDLNHNINDERKLNPAELLRREEELQDQQKEFRRILEGISKLHKK